MNKRDLVNDMKSLVDNSGFINSVQLAKYLRKSRGAMPDILEGLDYIASGRERKYFIPDVAERILELRWGNER